MAVGPWNDLKAMKKRLHLSKTQFRGFGIYYLLDFCGNYVNEMKMDEKYARDETKRRRIINHYGHHWWKKAERSYRR